MYERGREVGLEGGSVYEDNREKDYRKKDYISKDSGGYKINGGAV
jgi:hypothetical protein